MFYRSIVSIFEKPSNEEVKTKIAKLQNSDKSTQNGLSKNRLFGSSVKSSHVESRRELSEIDLTLLWRR